MDGKYLLSGATWSGEARLVLDAPGGSGDRVRLPVRGWRGTLARMRRRLCVGRFSLGGGGSQPCPDQAVVPPEYTECWACREASGFNPAFDRVDRSALSPQQRRYNARPHAVYLAHFGGDLTKVGISSRGRLPTRLREQGARVAVRLASVGSAYEARAIEVAVHERGYPEVVHDATKRRLLGEPFDAAPALDALAETAAGLRAELGLPDPEGPVRYALDADYLSEPLRLPLIDLTDQRPFRVGGRALGLYGKVLVMEQRGLHFGVSLTRAIGHVIQLDPESVPNPMPAGAGQLNLL